MQPAPPPLTIDVARRDGVVLVAPSGDIDLASVPDLERRLLSALGDLEQTGVLVLDLSRVAFLDSLGVGAVVATHRRARSLRRRVVVWRPSHVAATVLGITGLDQVLTIHRGDLATLRLGDESATEPGSAPV